MKIKSYKICNGNDDRNNFLINHTVMCECDIENNPFPSKTWYRTKDCDILIDNDLIIRTFCRKKIVIKTINK